MEKLNEFVKEIQEYESDTFSASGSAITEDEARQVLVKLVRGFFDSRLDGVLLSEALDEVREEEDESDE